MKSLQSLRRLVQSLPVGGGDPLRAAKQDQYFPTAGDPRDGTSGRAPGTAPNPTTRRSRSLAPVPAALKRSTDTETEALLRNRTASFDLESQQGGLRRGGPEGPTPVLGTLCLLGVAFLWGTYSPALRYIYSLDGPPTAEVLTAVRGLIQAIGLSAAYALSGRGALMASANKAKMRPEGLEATSATKGAFLIQATSLLTPLLAVANGERLSRWVWGGCGVALLSTCAIIIDSHDSASADAAAAIITPGDAAVLGAAFFYSVATVRLSHHARLVPSMALATAKSWVLASIAAAALLATIGSLRSGNGVATLWPGAGNLAAWTFIVWSALGPGALAAFLQTLGQSSVSAARAQIFYASTPIWSALLGLAVLHEDQLGVLGWMGALGLLASSLMANR